jgi:hypothetical protein
VLVVAVLLIAGVTSTAVALELGGEPATSPALCAPGDPNPEPGLQGDVPIGAAPDWDCGVSPVGFLGGANGAMAVAGHCAYTGGGLASGAGVRVIDVSDETKPALVKVLDTGSRELLAAQVTADRALLATRHRAEARDGQVLGRDMLVDVWDVRTCTDPKLLGTVRLPTTSDIFGDPPGEVGGPAHNLKFNPSATKLYGSLPVHEIDLTNLDDPSTWTARNLHCTVTNQTHLPHKTVPGLCEQLTETESPMGAAGGMPPTDHEPTFSPDGSRLYIGGQLPTPDSNNMTVLDMTGPDPVVLSVTEQAPGHSIDVMTINGRRYLLHSNEISATGCALPEELRPRYLTFADRAYVLDITDETAPVKTSEIRLGASRFDQCSPSAIFGPSTAYHEVDDPTDTTYAVIGFESAGFRIFDMRDPTKPVEVAYFNHGRSEHTKSYVIPETGHIWASDANGFWVLALEPQVRHHLGLDDPSAATVLGRQFAAPSSADVDAARSAPGVLPATGGSDGVVPVAAVFLVAAVLVRRLRCAEWQGCGQATDR